MPDHDQSPAPPGPAWVRCVCGEWWCRVHDLHAFECDCPDLEGWEDLGVDPYSAGGPPEEK